MPTPVRLRGPRSGSRRASTSRLLAVGVIVAAIASIAGVAVAASPTLGTGKVKINGKSKTVVVDAHGITLYSLSGESVGHLKCVSAKCFGFWPPYEVAASAKLTKAGGITGTLSRLHRVKGKFYQVMLNGHPLYRFSPDKGKTGSALGEGVVAFGGTWHVVASG
jgi:predicted lipoprotein with Yx(FWY)xxD motif